MDFYPTRYSELSNSEINELYRSAVWSDLSREERLDALQELENRAAEELGNKPCEVCIEQMNGAVYGYYSNGQIVVNENLVIDGILRYEDAEDNILEYAPDDVNAQIMDTIHHENYHAYQDDAVNGRIEHENQGEIDLWRANEDMYISPSDNDTLYRIQPQERSAFGQGELKTKAAFKEIESKYGEDTGYQEYLTTINENSYESVLTEAKETYDDEDIQETFDNYMLASYQENHMEDNDIETADTTSSTDSTADHALDSGSDADAM